jgi:hypothetical protein
MLFHFAHTLLKFEIYLPMMLSDLSSQLQQSIRTHPSQITKQLPYLTSGVH